jgi:hypothetical protein
MSTTDQGPGKWPSVHRLFLRISRLPKQALLPGLGSIGSSIRAVQCTNVFSKVGTGRRQIEVIWVMIADAGWQGLAGMTSQSPLRGRRRLFLTAILGRRAYFALRRQRYTRPISTNISRMISTSPSPPEG